MNPEPHGEARVRNLPGKRGYLPRAYWVVAISYPSTQVWVCVPHSVKKAAQRLAEEDGVSLNQWIAAAVAEKVGVVETAACFKKRAGNAKGDRLLKFLHKAPNAPAEPEDRIA